MGTRPHWHVDCGHGVCTLRGDVTYGDAALLRRSLSEMLRNSEPDLIVLDVRGVTTIEPAPLAELITVRHRMAANGRRLVLVDRNGPVSKELHHIGLLNQFQVSDELPESTGQSQQLGNRAG